jgi:glutathione S-transferase
MSYVAPPIFPQSTLGASQVRVAPSVVTAGTRRVVGQKAFPKLELVYFPVRARSETAEMMLNYGKVPYEKMNVQEYWDGKSWPEAKPETPYGYLPMLVVDGQTVINQSGSINRYIATLTGCYPPDKLTMAKCDQIYEYTLDLNLINAVINVFKGETFDEKKAEVMEKIPTFLSNLERDLGAGPFFCGSRPMYCDFQVYHFLSHIEILDPSFLEGQDALLAFMQQVEGLPGVNEYLASRPDCVDIGVAPMLKPKESEGV